jgi:aspartate/glutamate racemase
MHIGLIGGIGPAATDYYHRDLIGEHAACGRRLDLIRPMTISRHRPRKRGA